MKHVAFFLMFLILMAACGAETATEQPAFEPESASVDEDPVKGIAWFDGGVDDAFAVAKETGKPVFLYWGAEWCPPCHAISATIFSKPEFIERSKLFVPVYLDGDTENAQALGEKFGVVGYPTMIVFSAAGEELTRIPGGIDIQAYGNILDTTLTASSSARSLLERLMNGADALSDRDCTLLAYHSWGQDLEINADFDLIDGFRRMYDACPAVLEAERSILYMSWLDELQDAASESGDRLELSGEQRREALDMLESILASPALIRANIFRVVIDGAKYAALLTDPGTEERAALTQAFLETLDAIAADDSIYKRERIYTLVGKIRFERLDDEEATVSDDLQQQIRDMVAWADESTPSVYERQPVINALGNVLNEAGMDDVARPLMTAELEKSKQPYYFMVDLADIEQRAGNNDVALEWLRKAHDSTKGPATRFQWGYYYLNGLLEMTPDDTAKIHDTTVALVDELLQQSGGFHQRPKGQLKRLENKLVEWGADQGEALTAIRQSVQSICEAMPARDVACEAFLERT
ncbi:MAG: thioredoxin fold domain-containing protein [Woeseiaceae bacterium]|nr:thioredoxin family protein [Gammaproteobacteria bacterium]NND46697.1 thioredoxin fold domain-containing protein [Woeseiaceae bacterium]